MLELLHLEFLAKPMLLQIHVNMLNEICFSNLFLTIIKYSTNINHLHSVERDKPDEQKTNKTEKTYHMPFFLLMLWRCCWLCCCCCRCWRLCWMTNCSIIVSPRFVFVWTKFSCSRTNWTLSRLCFNYVTHVVVIVVTVQSSSSQSISHGPQTLELSVVGCNCLIKSYMN